MCPKKKERGWVFLGGKFLFPMSAYEGLIQLEGTDMFESERAFLEELIERGAEDK